MVGSVLGLGLIDFTPKNRLKIRIIFVSTTGALLLKADASSALDMYGPTPGKKRRLSLSLGTLPLKSPSIFSANLISLSILYSSPI